MKKMMRSMPIAALMTGGENCRVSLSDCCYPGKIYVVDT